MNIVILSLLMALPNVAFNQITQADSLALPADSTLPKLNGFLSDYAKEMSNWSHKKKKRFKKTFVMKRGKIKIPKQPIKLEER
jgi:hypothetical protein